MARGYRNWTALLGVVAWGAVSAAAAADGGGAPAANQAAAVSPASETEIIVDETVEEVIIEEIEQRIRPEPDWTVMVFPYRVLSELRGDEANPINTDADHTITGALVSAEHAVSDDVRVALTLNTGHSELDFINRFQIIEVNSIALGFEVEADGELVTLSVGGSGAHSDVTGELQNDRDEWDAWEWEVHAGVDAEINLAGPFWLAPQIAYRHLELIQEAHQLAGAIPRQTRRSDLFYGGVTADIRRYPVAGGQFRPWIFAGFTYDLRDQPPVGPSVFLNRAMAGTHITVFNDGASGVPDVFPSHLTGVFGAGADAELGPGVFAIAAYFHERNDDLESNMFRIGLTALF